MASYAMVADFHSLVINMTLRVMVLNKWVNVSPRGVEPLDVIFIEKAVFGAYGEGGPEVMIGDGPEGDRSNRMAKQARRNRALSKRKQSA
ncbi:unnamed protein product [Microthlaspi erraticum]|uniref:Uncharacterized protein n=1 Tax=Microthlaspi erraticum TaxID=1685480 RepID=A0A6D2IPU0_9BRAS|nr:unnamed protein product [Microthlaspi erraticum]